MVRLSWNVVIDHEQVGNGRIAGPTRLRVTWLNLLGLVPLMLSCVRGPAVSAAVTFGRFGWGIAPLLFHGLSDMKCADGLRKPVGR